LLVILRRLIFARAGMPLFSRRVSALPASEVADPLSPGRLVAVTAPLNPPPFPRRGGVRGDREDFQERAARSALRCARGRVVAAPVDCPVRDHEVAA
jgi:hypothetical protein